MTPPHLLASDSLHLGNFPNLGLGTIFLGPLFPLLLAGRAPSPWSWCCSLGGSPCLTLPPLKSHEEPQPSKKAGVHSTLGALSTTGTYFMHVLTRPYTMAFDQEVFGVEPEAGVWGCAVCVAAAGGGPTDLEAGMGVNAPRLWHSPSGARSGHGTLDSAFPLQLQGWAA